MHYSIRSAGPEDWPRARALRLEMLADSPHTFGDRLDDVLGWDDERWRVRASSMAMLDSTWVVAEDDDGRWLGQMTGREYLGEAWLIEVYVTPGARGAGLAPRLLGRVEAWARDRGHELLFLEVSDGAAGARRFYERAGFTTTGRESAHPLFPGDREMEMVKRLTDN